MRWKSNKTIISPINSNVEIILLKRALEKKPDNIRVFEKLIQVLMLKRNKQAAIDLCKSHLKVNMLAYTKLAYLYKRLGDIDSLISIAKEAQVHCPSIEIELYLAHAYAKKNNINDAKIFVLKHQNYANMSLDNLRLTLSILVKTDDSEKVLSIYAALPESRQHDSGLKISYLSALHNLNRYSEVRKLHNYDTMIVQKYLPELTTQTDIAALNQSLTEFFLAHPKQQYEPGEHATRYGTQLHFETDWHPYLKTLEVEIKSSVECYFSQSNIDIDSAFEIHFWAVIMDKNGHQTPHIHPDSTLSGVYYVRTPGIKADHDQAHGSIPGCLMFTQTENPDHCYIQPREGLLVLFPSYFYHQTVPLDHDKKRISIAFDVVRSSS